MRRPGWWAGGLAAGALVMAAGLLLRGEPAAVQAPTGAPRADNHPTAAGWSLLALGGGDARPANRAPDHPPERAPEDLLHTLFTDGSLQGAELDGGWGSWDGQRLAPSAALRRRFDQLLTTLGEASVSELRELVGWLAARDLGPSGALAVLAVWDRYLQLQQHPYREVMDLQNPQHWPAVLAERQRVRRASLGIDWADAFYGEAEQAFSQRLQAPAQPPPATEPTAWWGPAPQGVSPDDWAAQRLATLGPDAVARLQAEEQAQADWASRLDNARQALDRIARAPELSDQQKQAARAQWLAAHFQGSEHLRASTLLGL